MKKGRIGPIHDTDTADDIKEIGVGSVPNVLKRQQLKDGSLVISDNGKGGYLEFCESWSAEYIEQSWVKPRIPKVYKYLEDTYELEEGEIMLIPLVADHGRLKGGKGKQPELSTLYFALRFNVPSKIWSNDRWDDPLSDTDFQEKPKSKGKGKARAERPKPEPLYGTRQSTRKAAAKEEVEVLSDKGEGSSLKAPEHLTPVKIKTKARTQSPFANTGEGKYIRPIDKQKDETESKSRHLFLEIDSDSDSDFPSSLFGPTLSLPSTVSAISSSSGTTSSSSISISVTRDLSSAVSAVPASHSRASVSTTSGSSFAVAAVPVNSVTAPLSSSSVPVPSTSSSIAAPRIPHFGLPSILKPTTHSSRYFGSSSVGSSSGSFSSTHQSSSPRTGADYAAETAAMEAFNEFGNYREPKRTFDTAFLESSSFKSPERPSNNPWKRLRKSI
ncbi:hypothetical protein C8R45DRAFT_1109212 [Mycena sanguinolenta]|nr:hypothetical protein C8R45DRAFT_1109212 [Mycena sanguinolenta]